MTNKEVFFNEISIDETISIVYTSVIVRKCSYNWININQKIDFEMIFEPFYLYLYHHQIYFVTTAENNFLVYI